MQALDYENTPIHNLRVRAYDTNDTQLESFTLVQIILTDTNDNPPVFAAPSYTFSVNSDAVSGSPVGTVVATDDDGGVSGRVSHTHTHTQCNYTLCTCLILNHSHGTKPVGHTYLFV